MILICAGVIKFASVSSPTFSEVVALIPNWAWPLIPLFEILLGGWLVSGWMRFGAWIASLFTLLVFAIHNLELMSAGRSSCGCLGSSVDTSPRVMLGFDVFVALLLLWQRRRWAGWPTTDSPQLRQAATALTVTALALGTATVLAYAHYGSVTAAVADLRSEPLAVVPTDLELGQVDPDTVIETSVRVHNFTDEPAHLTYAKGSCSCANFPDLPLVVPPHGTADIRVSVTVSGPPGRFQRLGIFRTNIGQVRFGIRGHIPERDDRPNDPKRSASP